MISAWISWYRVRVSKAGTSKAGLATVVVMGAVVLPSMSDRFDVAMRVRVLCLLSCHF